MITKKHLIFVIGLLCLSICLIGTVSANDNNTFYDVNALNSTEIDTNFIADDFVKYFHNSSNLEFSLVDNNSSALKNQTVIILINGINYTRHTNENGSAKMTINLAQGNYTADLFFNGNDVYKPTNKSILVTVLPLIKSKDITKYFKNETSFFVTLINYDGNPANKSKVTFNINGVLYNKTSNSKASAVLDINLAPGKYIITSMYNGCFVSNNITVFSLIESNNLVKYFRNNSQFSVKAFNKDGSKAVDKIVTFNVAGQIFERVTDVFGIAKLNIYFEPGEYVITTFFNDLSQSNTIKVLSTVVSQDIELTTINRIPFSVKVLDSNGLPAAYEKLSFIVNGVEYNRISDSNGLAKLNINLDSGEYVITTLYNGLMQFNTIRVL